MVSVGRVDGLGASYDKIENGDNLEITPAPIYHC
jgi:hypothetical protein